MACVANAERYDLMDLERGERIPLFPIMQNANFSDDDSATVPTLPPLMVSVGEDDFLVTTGTALTDPAIGLFVNLNGDPVRGTLMFSTYPRALSILPFISANQSYQLPLSFCHDAGLQRRDTFCRVTASSANRSST